MTSTASIRQAFLDFFARNGHEIVPSSSLVPHNDPSLMFTNAGMVPFKNVFTGAEKRKYVRATSSQKCVRAGGKHNDLDNVGYTARHHTFFEMLGNFSFGDYFKEGAIEFAWKYLRDELKLPQEKLLITAHPTDDEARTLWKKIAGFSDNRIISIPENIWMMGLTGPCGRISEIFYDHGAHISGGPPGSKDEDGDRFVEIWNLVFMQYEQINEKTRIDLPKPCIDTGMGLERIAAVMQGVSDNYDIDLFKGLIRASEDLTRTKAEGAEKASHRVIADHLRSSCFLLADGVMPSNEGRGYVLRRIMRRAMRHAQQLGAKEPLMHRLVPALIHEMGEQYPELVRAQALMTGTLKLEEERFRQTLERGLKLLEEEAGQVAAGGILPGSIAFKLYDTYGFPLDLTQDILRAEGKSVDVAEFGLAMSEQKERARAAWTGSGDKTTGRIWFEVKDKVGATEFLGYAQDEAAANLIAIVAGGKEVDEIQSGEAMLIFNQTPFYGESGGQMGDTGVVRMGGKTVAEITDTQKPIDDTHAHKATIKAPLKLGDMVTLHVDAQRRARIRANHSATHILHAVLRRQLGDHITQKGSLVAPDKLRFDISHPKAMTKEEIANAEAEVNRIIWQNAEVHTRLMTPDEAVKQGAMALFGEKYGDEVRVLSMGMDEDKAYSTELCGGTHVHATGDIGLFKITSESAVAAGIRRIEAVTRDGAFAYLSEQDMRVRDIAQQFKASPAELEGKITALQNERKRLEKELGDAKKSLALSGGSEKAEVETIGKYKFSYKHLGDLEAKELRGVLADYLGKSHSDLVITSTSSGGLGIATSSQLAPILGSNTLYSYTLQPILGGKGGGRPEMTQAGGINTDKIEEAIDAARTKLKAL
jgi:alanyl-tRNA synthetase